MLLFRTLARSRFHTQFVNSCNLYCQVTKFCGLLGNREGKEVLFSGGGQRFVSRLAENPFAVFKLKLSYSYNTIPPTAKR